MRQSAEIPCDQRELPNEAKQKTSGEIDEQRSIWKRSAHANLHDALQAVPRERAGGAEQRNKENLQSLHLPSCRGANKKLLAPRGSQESSVIEFSAGRFMANSIAFQFRKGV